MHIKTLKINCRKRSLSFRMFFSILLLVANFTLLAQQKRITGTVKNPADNKGIPGANVQVKGTARGASTNDNGDFTISAAQNETLVISTIGFETREIKVGNQTNIQVQLATTSRELESVVVTALGIKREEKALGYSASKIAGGELTEALPNNWSNALQGRAAGVNLIKSGGGPAGSNKIILRGENSLFGTSEALIVLDGVVISGSSGRQTGTGSSGYLAGESPIDFGTSINDINPEDIETVTVLKGPAASALYGSRGGNGAVMITTKSGRSSSKGLGVAFNSNASMETILNWPDYQEEYGQGDFGQDSYYSYLNTADGTSTRSTSSAWGPKFNGQSYFQYDPVTRTTGAERTPWRPYKDNRKDFFQTASTLTNTVTVDGGNANTSVRLSYTNLQNKWIIPNTGYQRNSVAFSMNHKISDKLQFAAKVNYTNKNSDNLPTTGYNNQTIMYFIRGMAPNMDLNWFKEYWAPGQDQILQTRPFSSLLDNPYLQAYEMLNKMDRNGVIGNVSATYNITKDLSLMVRTALDFSYESRSQQRPKSTQKFADGMYRTQSIYNQESNTDFLLRYTKKVSDKFEFSGAFGGSALKNKYKKDELRVDRLLYPGIYSFSNAKVTPIAFPFTSEFRVNSFFGFMQFTYDKFLYLELTGRNDWNSTLATDSSTSGVSFFYPSANLSAVLSDKIQMPEFISFMKIRASVAGVGDGALRPYVTSYGYQSRLGFPSGLTNPTIIPSNTLGPLRINSYEVGANIRVLKNRIGVDVAYYINNSDRQIIDAPIDRASGYSAATTNAGLVRNSGLELELNASILKSVKGLNWTLFSTYTANRNKVVSLAEGFDSYVVSTGPRGTVEARVGGSMGDIYGLGYVYSPEGRIVYSDQGLPLLSDTSSFIGNTMPRWKFSVGNEFKFRQFRFSFMFDGQYGGSAYSLTHSVLADEGKLKKTIPGRYNGIIGNGVILNPDGKTYRENDVLVTNIDAYYTQHFGRDNVESNTFNTDFIKLREVRLDYTFKPSLLAKLKVQRASIGVYGRDLLMISKWPAFDPEFGTLGDGTVNAGFETGQFPSTRTMGVNLIVGF